MIPFLDLQAAYREDAAAYDAAYHRVMDSGRWILGPECAAFEAEFAAHCGAAQAIGMGNGLDALRLALEVAGIGPGDEVIVPAHTFIATWLAVQQCGATPVPVEPAGAQAGAYTVDAAGVAAAITPRTKAVMPVHLYGHGADPESLRALCTERGLWLIEDAAQAQGARHGGRALGRFGAMGAFSFYPGKNLGAFGDAGAVITDDPALAQALRERRNYGSRERYAHDSLGTNSRLDELQAAFLRVRLARLDAHNRRRAEVAARYTAQLAELAEPTGGATPGASADSPVNDAPARLVLPATRPGDQPAWHLYVVRTPQRDALQAALARQGIDTLVHYPRPVYRFAPFAHLGPPHRTASDALCDEILSLPMGPHLSNAQVDQVCEAVRAHLRSH